MKLTETQANVIVLVALSLFVMAAFSTHVWMFVLIGIVLALTLAVDVFYWRKHP